MIFDDKGRTLTRIIDINTGNVIAEKMYDPLPDANTDFEEEVIKLHGTHKLVGGNSDVLESDLNVPVNVTKHRYLNDDRTLMQVSIDQFNFSFLPEDLREVNPVQKPVISQAFNIIGIDNNKIQL